MVKEDYTRLIYKTFYNSFENKKDALAAIMRALELLSDDFQNDELLGVCLSNAAWHLKIGIGNRNE